MDAPAATAASSGSPARDSDSPTWLDEDELAAQLQGAHGHPQGQRPNESARSPESGVRTGDVDAPAARQAYGTGFPSSSTVGSAEGGG